MGAFKGYFDLRAQVDREVANLLAQHQGFMVCQKGCDSCCYGFSVFPVEFYAIQSETGLKGDYEDSDRTEGLEKCAFLKNHVCSIYSSRPIICRTHGLPLLRMNDEGTDWELSVCELNFTETDEDYFDEDNVLIQDKVNSQLFQLNKSFLEVHPELKLGEFDLIPLKSLLLL